MITDTRQCIQDRLIEEFGSAVTFLTKQDP